MNREWDEEITLEGNWKILRDSEGNTYLAFNHGDFHTMMYIGELTVPPNSKLENAINLLRSQGEIGTLTQ